MSGQTIADAYACHRTGRLNDAACICDLLLAADPDDHEALHLKGLVALQGKQYGQAVDAIARAIAVCNTNRDYHFHLTLARISMGEYEAAEAACRRLLDLSPDDAHGLVTLGNLLEQRDKRDDAIACYRQATETGDAIVEAPLYLGRALRKDGRVADAIEAFRRALAIVPNHADARRRLQEAEQAQSGLAIFAQPQTRIAGHEDLVKQGDEKRAQGDLAAAVAAYQEALAQDPGHAATRCLLAYTQLMMAEPDAALSELERVLSASPCDVQALSLKSVALVQAGGRDAEQQFNGLDRFIRVTRLAAEPPFDDPGAFAAELAEAVFYNPTLHQDTTTKGGLDTGEIFASEAPAVAAYKRFLEREVAAYFARLPAEPHHPFTARRVNRFSMSGWGVRMTRDGHQVPHVHHAAWLSAVVYPQLPKAVREDDPEQQGWIEFGRAWDELYPIGTPAVRRIRPEEGMVVLFPSYVWHRTLPFASDEVRISIAVDIAAQD